MFLVERKKHIELMLVKFLSTYIAIKCYLSIMANTVCLDRMIRHHRSSSGRFATTMAAVPSRLAHRDPAPFPSLPPPEPLLLLLLPLLLPLPPPPAAAAPLIGSHSRLPEWSLRHPPPLSHLRRRQVNKMHTKQREGMIEGKVER